MRDFNAFVVACEPIARGEVQRLRRLGSRFDVEDAVQGALLSLIESRHLFPDAPTLEGHGGMARLHVRHRLINNVVQYSKARKRSGFHVPIDHARDVATASHENAVIGEIDAERILTRFPAPTPTATTRQGKWAAENVWRREVRLALGLDAENAGTGRLTEDDVRAIRASNESQRALSLRYRVCRAHIQRVLAGENWRDVAQKTANDNAFIKEAA